MGLFFFLFYLGDFSNRIFYLDILPFLFLKTNWYSIHVMYRKTRKMTHVFFGSIRLLAILYTPKQKPDPSQLSLFWTTKKYKQLIHLGHVGSIFRFCTHLYFKLISYLLTKFFYPIFSIFFLFLVLPFKVCQYDWKLQRFFFS